MFYIVNILRPYDEYVIGTKEFERILRNYVIDISELTVAQYETFKGTLFALDLLKELIPSVMSHYELRFTPDE